MHTSHSTGEDADFPSAAEPSQEHTWECDFAACTANHTEVGDFRPIWETLKAKGWKARVVGLTWKHYCPEHAKRV